MPEAVKTEHPHIVRLEGVCGGEKVSCRLEVTVKECEGQQKQEKQENRSVACPCPSAEFAARRAGGFLGGAANR